MFRSFYTGISIRKLLEEGALGPERFISGLPEGSKINFVSWYATQTHTQTPPSHHLGLMSGMAYADDKQFCCCLLCVKVT